MRGSAGQVGERRVGAERRRALRIPLRHRAQRQRVRALDDEQAHGTVALQLHDEAAGELERRREQRGRRKQFGQHAREHRRIRVAREHRANGIGDRDERAAHRRVLEHEPRQRIDGRRHVRRHAAFSLTV